MRIETGHAKAIVQPILPLSDIALNLINKDKISKVGVKIKRLKAGWDNDYLLRIIGII